MNDTKLPSDNVHIGYIKLKFALLPGKQLWEHRWYEWLESVGRVRVTNHFCYVALGHEAIRDDNHATETIRMAIEMHGKITRLDFYVDYLGLLDHDVYYELVRGQKRFAPSRYESDDGWTIYRGKRSSARMMRIYDKRAEILAKKRVDVGFDITRIELEVKRNWVKHYCYLWMSGKKESILSDIQALSELRGFCEKTPSTTLDTSTVEDIHSAMAFVRRYRCVIGSAYRSNKGEFLEIIGESDNEKCNI